MRRDTGRESISRRVRRCSMGQIFQNFLKQEKYIKGVKKIKRKKQSPLLKCCPHQKSQKNINSIYQKSASIFNFYESTSIYLRSRIVAAM